MDEHRSFVITGDFIGSKSSVQNTTKIQDKLNQMNVKFGDALMTPFMLLRGDEVQAMVHTEFVHEIPNILRAMKRMYGVQQLRIGLGYGRYDDEPNQRKSLGSWSYNGPAFHRAREAIDSLHDKRNETINPNTAVRVFSNPIWDETAELLFYTIDTTLRKWDDETWTIVDCLEQGMTHEEIRAMMSSKGIDRNRSAYTKRIHRSGWYLIRESERIVVELIKGELGC